MSFGFGVGDFIAVGELAWRVYKATKDAPHAFYNIHQEVLSLHAVLKEAEETISISPLSGPRRARLETVLGSCSKVLDDIQRIVDKYDGCAVQTRWTWERLRWSKEDVTELRSRLTANVTMLTTFMSMSQVYVGQRLDRYLNDCQRGRREGSIASTHSVDSILKKDKAAWRTMFKELENVGITADAVKANHDFIVAWFIGASENGDSEERDPSRPRSHAKKDTSQFLESPAMKRSSDRSRKALAHRAAKVMQAASLPADRLVKYTERGNYDEVLRILARPLVTEVVDRCILNWILLNACRDSCNESTITSILESGASVNCHESRKGKKDGEWDKSGWHYDINCSPLMAAAYVGNTEVLTLLLHRRANINFCKEDQVRYWNRRDKLKCYERETSRNPTPLPTPLGCAVAQNRLSTVKILVSAGASINQGVEGFAPLHQACSTTAISQEVCQELLKWGAAVDASWFLAGTPLMMALQVGNLEISRLLLENGADAQYSMEACNSDGHSSPLEVALSPVIYFQGTLQLAAVKLLKDYGAVLNSQQAVALTWLEANISTKPTDHDPLRQTDSTLLPLTNPSSTTPGLTLRD